jgi:hypothetical protein
MRLRPGGACVKPARLPSASIDLLDLKESGGKRWWATRCTLAGLRRENSSAMRAGTGKPDIRRRSRSISISDGGRVALTIQIRETGDAATTVRLTGFFKSGSRHLIG